MITDILICALAITTYLSVLTITSLLMAGFEPYNSEVWFVTWDKEEYVTFKG